ncbi:hypothetical protein A3Q56_06120, partial [Intoshia linei]
VYNNKRKLKIGYFWEDDSLCVLPCMKRGILECIDHLKENYEIVEWKPINITKCFSLFTRVIFADGGKSFYTTVKNDDLIENLKRLYRLLQLPRCMKKCISIYSYISKDIILKAMMSGVTGVGSYNNWIKLAIEFKDYRNEVLKSWDENNIDLVIAPGMAIPSVQSKYLVNKEIVAWPNIYPNVLDFVAGCMPVSNVLQSDFEDMIKEEKINKKWCYKQIADITKNQNFINMPINIQIYGRPNSEELVLSLMKELEEKIKYQIPDCRDATVCFKKQ